MARLLPWLHQQLDALTRELADLRDLEPSPHLQRHYPEYVQSYREVLCMMQRRQTHLEAAVLNGMAALDQAPDGLFAPAGVDPACR